MYTNDIPALHHCADLDIVPPGFHRASSCSYLHDACCSCPIVIQGYLMLRQRKRICFLKCPAVRTTGNDPVFATHADKDVQARGVCHQGWRRERALGLLKHEALVRIAQIYVTRRRLSRIRPLLEMPRGQRCLHVGCTHVYNIWTCVLHHANMPRPAV
jgi:hypothetical protein